MIINVSKCNVIEWAYLCVALWPDNTIDYWLEEYAKGDNPYEFLYYIENQAVAFLSLALRHDYVEGTDSSPVAYLEGIYVKPDFRKRGIAKELVDFAKKWAIEQNCSELASDCEITNENSRIFHSRIGFHEANTIVCFTMKLHSE